ncbi:MAG: glycine cleavage system protein GcvH [Planctomycetota bacterium]|jgi:glycine cleavage system H protein|nr:glycine cleavage system protein GcvH [Planctomycetota bacterium]
MKELDELLLPENLRYAEDHEWISETAPFRIGISDFAQDQLGDLTFVELPEVGAVFAKGDEFGALESTKSVSPLYIPVDGKVTAINAAVRDDPGKVNEDPYGDGWLIEIEPSDPAEIGKMMDRAAYKKRLEESPR